MGEMTTWQNDLFGTSQTGLVNLNYLPNGSYFGRQDYLAGSVDYVLSGVPFTSDQFKQLPGGASGLIDAPVQVAAMGILASPVQNVAQPGRIAVLRQFDDANQDIQWIPYTGPLRVPSPNLAAMLFNFSGTLQNRWDNPDVINALGVTLECPTPTNGLLACDTFTPTPPDSLPVPVLRSEPSETDYYLQQFAATAAPTVWSALQKSVKRSFAPSERLPQLTALTRPGVQQQVDYFGTPATPNQILEPVPPYATTIPKAPQTWIQVQNAAGQWEQPTPASIDAAVDAGGNTPLYALTNNVDGAYPLVWVTHMYAPAHGLSVEKTEALATTIRYLATAGQAATSAAGDGRLSTALVLQALAAANQLVKSNCTGSGRTITVSDSPGPYAPPSLAAQSIGPMDHCQAAPPTPPATTTTSARPTSTTSPPTRATAALSSSGGTSTPPPIGGSASGGSVAGTTASAEPATQAASAGSTAGPGGPPPATARLVPVAGSSPKNGAVVLTALPLAPPWSGGRGWDTLSGLVIGALLYLAARRPARALLRNLRE
jgi:hypothetical protein